MQMATGNSRQAICRWWHSINSTSSGELQLLFKVCESKLNQPFWDEYKGY